jgi:hypothetical protein
VARKITFIARTAAGDDAVSRNIEHSNRLGHPLITQSKPVASRLAVVGGSPWVKDHLDELKAWDGDIWAINGALVWCLDNGIDAIFYTIDPMPTLAPIAKRATRAILGSSCHPDVFAAVNGPIEVFPFGELPSGSTTACTAPMAAATKGHTHITFFGCESSFEDKTHAYSCEASASRVLVECGGVEYLTTPQLIMQAEYLGEIARQIPSYIDIRGRGFLPALVEHGDYSVSKVSPDIMESIRDNCDLQRA